MMNIKECIVLINTNIFINGSLKTEHAYTTTLPPGAYQFAVSEIYVEGRQRPLVIPDPQHDPCRVKGHGHGLAGHTTAATLKQPW